MIEFMHIWDRIHNTRACISNFSNAVCIKHPRLLYVCIGPIDLLEFIEQMDPKFSKPAIFHLYVIQKSDVKEYERIIKRLNFIRPKSSPHYKYIIHVPTECEDLIPLVKQTYGAEFGNTVQIHKEKYITEYKIGGLWITPSINSKTRILKMSIKLHSRQLMEEKEGFIKNDLEAESPELYKDKIIANFKATTPMGILKTFKNEEDIWNYIMKDSEWRSHKKDHQNQRPLNPVNPAITNKLEQHISESNNTLIDDLIKSMSKH